MSVVELGGVWWCLTHGAAPTRVYDDSPWHSHVCARWRYTRTDPPGCEWIEATVTTTADEYAKVGRLPL